MVFYILFLVRHGRISIFPPPCKSCSLFDPPQGGGGVNSKKICKSSFLFSLMDFINF